MTDATTPGPAAESVKFEEASLRLRDAELGALSEVVEVFVKEALLETDGWAVRQAIERAQRDSESLESWADQVKLVGKEMGLRLTACSWSLRSAAAHALPGHSIAVRARSAEAAQPWILIRRGGWFRARVAFVNELDGSRQVTKGYGELARLLGVNNASETLDVITSQPLMPWEGPVHLTHGAHGDVHSQGSKDSPLARLARLMRPERQDLWNILLFSAATGLLSLATPLAVDSVVNQVAFGSLPQPLLFLVLALFVALALSGVLRAIQYYLAELIQRRLFLRLATDIAYRLPRVRSEAFERQHAPEIVNQFFAVSTLQKTASTILLDGINVALSGTIGMVILGFYHPALLVFDVFMIFSVIVILFVLGRGAVRTSIDDSESMYRAIGWLEEIGRFPVAFKNPFAAELALAQGDRANQAYLAARARHFRILMRQTIGALTLQAIGSTALLAIGGQLVIDGTLTLGQLVAAELIVTVVLAAVSKLSKQLEAWYDVLAAVDKLGHLIDLPLEREGGERVAGDDRGASVELDNVDFGYPHDPTVLTEVSLSIRPGERVGIHGSRSEGSSTLLELIFGLRDPNHGSVSINGVDVRQWRLDAMRAEVAIVRQDDVLKGSVRDNVVMGRSHLRHVDVKDALDSVGLWDVAVGLQGGINTVLMSDGAPLSTTARLRLVLARALIGRPRVLLVDGLIDRLRSRDRARAIRAVFDTKQVGSVVIVSQLPDVLERCDRVFEIVEGRLAHHASHGGRPETGGRPQGKFGLDTREGRSQR